MGKRRVTLKTIDIVPTENANLIEVEMYYNQGGWNHFYGKEERRGYYVSVTATKIERHDGYQTQSIVMGSGVKMFIEPATRYSDSKLYKLSQNIPTDVEAAIEQMVFGIMNKFNLKLAEKVA